MTQTIQDLVAKAKTNSSFQEQRVLLRAKYLQQLDVAHNGGLFTLSPQLLYLLKNQIDTATDPTSSDISIVLVDNNTVPIKVTDCATLYKEWLEMWTVANNDYFVKYNKLKMSRNPLSIITNA